MKYSLRSLMIVAVIFAGCWSPKVIDDSLKLRLASTAKVQFVFYGLEDDGIPQGYTVTLDTPQKIAECMETLAKERNWQPKVGSPTADWGTKITFLDAAGAELWRCKTVGASITCESPDGKEWRATWKDWVEWTENITNAKELAKENALPQADPDP
ncbi:MAG: hypothetical protein IAF94_00350 [Pirellulaceae bacterium]|nr:hypothetical protein [Pirellulaceae bacterium]